MFSISTAEIRWFYPGSIPDKIYSWLKGKTGFYEDQPLRTDNYLLLPEQENLGIKLRQGRMEIKKRTEVHPEYIAPGIAGSVESWIKWSIPAEQHTDSLQHILSDQAHWVAIQKNRSVQKYAIGEYQSVIPYPSEGYPKEGVMLESCELLINSQTWWTLAIECFGPSEKVHSNLLTVIPGMLKTDSNLSLSVAYSSGYPEWISRIAP